MADAVAMPTYEPSTSTRPAVMGVLNVTPDSFSDGGRYHGLEAARRARDADGRGRRCHHRRGRGVDAAAARPGWMPRPSSQRVVPVIERIAAALDVAISIDTSKLEVMTAAVQAGACIVNDVRALRAPGAREWAAEAGVGVCLMHMQGEPRTMQDEPGLS